MTAGVNAATAGNAAAVQAAVIARATRASGVIVRVEPQDFLIVIELNDAPLVVHTTAGFFSTHHQYLTSYRGLAFFTKSGREIGLPGHCQVVEAKKIWIPS